MGSCELQDTETEKETMREIRIPLTRENERGLERTAEQNGIIRFTDYELIATFLADLKAGDPAVLEYLQKTRIRSNDLGDVLGEEALGKIVRLFELYIMESVPANEKADRLLQELYSEYKKRCIDSFLWPRSLPMFLEHADIVSTRAKEKALSPSEQSK